MDREYYKELARVRLERAKELLKDALELLDKESYKSANNRAFYAMEKSIKALLATEEVETATHNGRLKQFNYLFIHKGNGDFTIEDYQKIAKAEQIRNASDYDDFYIAGKEETKQQIDNAEYIVDKVDKYLKNNA
ncbi:MAG: HEPN domain-containing protein [Blautia sp.]|nr:HEPN domain-containing protein [Lachnoclostridium sp.]MCM1211174.1 HEPN domain-containing protein [Blautia sp.]